VRGALEAGVGYACGFPGTPSSEITDGFARISKLRPDIAFEYSVNEKIAVEMAFAASLAGTRSICSMKHLGLMVAGDPLSTIPYIGIVGGMVIVSPGDPSCRTSPNEQDQRHLGPMLHIPVLDPSTPAEAHQLARFAFELSEACKLPVLLRPTTRVCHSRAPIVYGPLRQPEVTGFKRDPKSYVPIPFNARRMRLELPGRMDRARALIAKEGLFRTKGKARTVVLASGAPAATCSDVIDELGIADDIALWTLAALHPLPEEQILQALAGAERLLVVEELTPFLEDAVSALCARHGLKTEIMGKHTGHLPGPFEYSPDIIAKGLLDAFDLGTTAKASPDEVKPALPLMFAPPRPPTLCPGCGHRSAFLSAKLAFDEEQLFFNDIGCYTLGYGPPLNTADAVLCMGAGYTLAAGVARVTGKRTVGFVGDATFFHSGMPALLNAIKEKANMVAVILDNQVIAMTGFQESISKQVSFERIAEALGATDVQTVDPNNIRATTAALRRTQEHAGVSVVVMRRACATHEARKLPAGATVTAFEIDQERCRRCGHDELRCGQATTNGYQRSRSRSRVDQCGAAAGSIATVEPCSARCPLSLCIQGYVGHIAAGEYGEALGHILSRTPLPESVCRVCDHPCEDVCVRATIDAPVAINDLKRFVVTWAADNNVPAASAPAPNGKRVAIVGAGPSGLAAAHELAMRGYAVTMYDARERPGGLLAYGIPEYRLPQAMLQRDIDRILELGVRFVGGATLGRDIGLAGLLDGSADEASFDAIYLAIGLSQAKTLDIDGSDGEGTPQVVDALSYLAASRGYLAASRGDDAPFTGKHVVVIGGGNSAIDAARTAARRGAQVTLACIETRPQMPAIGHEIAAAEVEGVRLLDNLRPQTLEPGRLVLVPFKGTGKGAGNGAGSATTLDCDQVILAIGQSFAPEHLGGATAVALGDDGMLRIDPKTCRTSHPKIYAGGDSVGGEQSVTAAMASGLRAAWSIDREHRGAALADERMPPLPPRTTTADSLLAGRSLQAPRAERRRPNEIPSTQRYQRGFDEVVEALDEDAARAEAARCLACGQCGNCRACIDLFGCPAIDMNDGKLSINAALCNGCGVCAMMCPNGAIVPSSTASSCMTPSDGART
jgi:indolepyruvate ferredoxin oxidoreductase alpha subunit